MLYPDAMTARRLDEHNGRDGRRATDNDTALRAMEILHECMAALTALPNVRCNALDNALLDAHNAAHDASEAINKARK